MNRSQATITFVFVVLLARSMAFAEVPSSVSSLIAASDARFRYEGRIDASDAAAPILIWQASRIRIDFDGDSLILNFSNIKGQAFFDVTIDGHTSIVEFREGSSPADRAFSGLGPDRHQLVLFKRSEAAAGTVAFRGIETASGAHAYAPGSAGYKLRMLFIGDSITAGACNEDGAADQWADRRTHNAAKSYAALVAAAFDAEYRNISVSGMGVCTGWVSMLAGNIWDRVYPEESSARADLSSWLPDVVFVNLGENDEAFPRFRHLPFPPDFTDRYVALVQAIRRAWPRAEIVLLRSGDVAGAKNERLRLPWKKAAARLEQTDQRVSDFVIHFWTETHPRVSEHRIMADELIDWLRRQPFMALQNSPAAERRSP